MEMVQPLYGFKSETLKGLGNKEVDVRPAGRFGSPAGEPTTAPPRRAEGWVGGNATKHLLEKRDDPVEAQL